MLSRSRSVHALSVVLLLAAGPSLLAGPTAEPTRVRQAKPTRFLRILKDKDGQPMALQTAIVRYVPASGEAGVTVDLVAAVHIGDHSYYEALNRRFRGYDAVLYELVAPEGRAVPRKGQDGDNPLRFVQKLMTAVLDLDFQLERIDYTRKNFVHADLSPEGMAEAIRKRGDDGLTLALSIAADVLRQQNLQHMEREKSAPREADAGDDFDPASFLLDGDGPARLKRAMAEQFESAFAGAGLGKTLNAILVSDRNRAALRVFQKELARGKKNLAIFYGAAHMPDFEKRLREDYGLKRQSVTWVTAWDLQKRGTGLEALLKLLEP